MLYRQFILRKLAPHRRRMLLALGAMLLIMLADLGSPLVVAILIDYVVGRGLYHWLAPLMIAFLCLPLMAAAARLVSNQAVSVLGQRVIFDIRLELFRRVQQLHCRYMHATTTGKIMERLRGDVNQLQMVLTQQGPQVLIQVITGLLMIVFIVFVSARLAMLVFLGVGLYVLNYSLLVPRIKKIQRRYRRKLERLSGIAQEKLTGAIVVKSFGRERQEARDFVKRNFAAERVAHRFRDATARYQLYSGMVTYSTYSVLLLYGVYLAVQGEVSYGAVTAVTAYAMRLLVPAAMLAELSNQIQQARVSLDRIFELMNAPADQITQTGLRKDNLQGRVELRDVHFQYEPGKPVLRGLDLTVEPGMNVALVGQTGCGKSTIINLLYRYYDVTQGQLLIDGVDIREYDVSWLRHRMAIVPQEPIILDTTIAENIAYGRPHADRDAIAEAASMAELDELLNRLDKGLDTAIGEYGVTLSVGEKQRLCIARAMLADPIILILDEATSSLDTKSETSIQTALKRVMHNRTSFVVAHRLSTIVHSDKIVVLDNGLIHEAGTHEELMEIDDGMYRKLYLTQTQAAHNATP
jgi:ABC-type multidrug transport system fused ATPase/permease subunit